MKDFEEIFGLETSKLTLARLSGQDVYELALMNGAEFYAQIFLYNHEAEVKSDIQEKIYKEARREAEQNTKK